MKQTWNKSCQKYYEENLTGCPKVEGYLQDRGLLWHDKFEVLNISIDQGINYRYQILRDALKQELKKTWLYRVIENGLEGLTDTWWKHA